MGRSRAPLDLVRHEGAALAGSGLEVWQRLVGTAETAGLRPAGRVPLDGGGSPPAPAAARDHADRIGSPSFLRCSAAVRDACDVRRPARALSGWLRLPTVLAYLLRLPRLEIPQASLTPSFRENFYTPRLGLPRRRWGQAVLLLGDTQEQYLRGRSRQAVRTNLRHAEELGFRVVTPETAASRRDLEGALVERIPGMHRWGPRMHERPSDVWLGVVDRAGQSVGVALVSPSARVALLKVFAVDPSVSGYQFARHLLHAELISHLRNRGMDRLVVFGQHPLRQNKSLTYFQHLLGYQLRDVRVAST